MELVINYLYPFDLGMELDLPVESRRYAKELIRPEPAGQVVFEGGTVGQASWLGYVYPFGMGMIEVSFSFEGDLADADRLAIYEERLHVGKYSLPVFLRNNKNKVIEKARAFARFVYPQPLDVDEEIFALFRTADHQKDLSGESFIRKNSKSLFRVVTGEATADALSDYALEKEALKNIGYYENEVIILKRFGAFIHSRESSTLKDLIALGLAQYFNIKASNAFLGLALGRAQKIVEQQPPFTRFWKIPAAYQRLSSEQSTFYKAKISVVESLHTASAILPQIDSDWHLKSVHKEILAAFNLEEQGKVAMLRLETIDSIYNQLSEHLSTVFFIFLDFVFMTWLLVDLAGWILLLTRTKPL